MGYLSLLKWKTVCAFKKPATIPDWLLFHSSMSRTKVMPRVGWKKGPQPGAHALSTPLLPDELHRRREEVGRLEDVWRWSPGSSLTWQLAQMAVEVGPSGISRVESASSIRPTIGGKAPHKEFTQNGLMKRPWKYQPGMVALHKIYYWAPHLQMPLCAISKWDSPRMQEIWPVLPDAHGHGIAGSSWILFDQPPGRCQPVCHPCKAHYYNDQGYSICPSYLHRAPPLLESVLVFCCCGLCWGCWYGEESNHCM